MSKKAKTVFLGAALLSGLTIWGVHFLQEWERDRMYEGVLRDEERRREKQRQRKAAFDTSLLDRQVFEQTQTVRGSNAAGLLPDMEGSHEKVLTPK